VAFPLADPKKKKDVEDVKHRNPHVMRAPASMTWGKETTNETDLGEVAQSLTQKNTQIARIKKDL